jgi:glycosyltransferase involved in cell wall biosynthesis
MLLSVVISTYNGEKYIIEQLNSIRNQDRKADEVIISDDCSTDNTVIIIEEYIKRYNLDSWKLQVNEVNKGWRKNFFDLINRANGDLIFTCDQDDIWENNKLLLMEKIMHEHNEILLLTSSYRLFYENGKELVKPNLSNGQLLQIKPDFNFFNTSFPGCTYCIRRDFVDQTKLYWNASIPHDAFYFRMALYSDGLSTICIPLIKWRQHTTSAYSKEVALLRTYSERRNWLEYAENSISIVISFLYDDRSRYNKEYMNILEINIQYIRLRKRFYNTKNPFLLIQLLFYKKCYINFNRVLLDGYLVYFKSSSERKDNT